MMKIAKVSLLSISDCTEKNGVVTFINTFLQRKQDFLRNGLDITAYCYRDAPAAAPSSKCAPATGSAGTPAADMPRQSSTFQARLKVKVKSWFNACPTTAFVLFALSIALRGGVVYLKSRLRGRPDIYFHQDFFAAFFAAVCSSRTEKHVLVLHSGSDPLRHLFIWFPALRDTFYESWIRRAFDYAVKRQDALVVLNQGLVAQLGARYSTKPVHCVYNTALELTDAGILAKSPQCLNLVAVGSLQYVKGFDLLIEAIAGMPELDKQRIRVVVVGDGPDRSDLSKAIAHNGLSDKVFLVGNTDNVGYYLRGADAYILTSRDEGLPIALIEALQVGLPIISTRVGTIPEIMDEDNCVFIDGSVADIREKISLILSGMVDLEAMSVASLEIYREKLSPEIFVTKYSHILAQLHSA
jgi:glycosyltransferase involved in cell wall biosynthesis